MDVNIIAQALTEQNQLLKEIRDSLHRLESKVDGNTIQQQQPSNVSQGSPALAHLNSLGINW